MQSQLQTQTTFFDSSLSAISCLKYSHHIWISYSTMQYFFLSPFLHFDKLCAYLNLNCADSTAFMHSSELEGAVLLGNTLLSPGNLWIRRRLLLGHSKGLSEVFNCHKTETSGAVSRRAESMFRGNICSNRITPKYIFRMTFLFLPSTGINYFSAFCGNLVSVFIKFIFVSFYLLMPFLKNDFVVQSEVGNINLVM